MKKLNLVLLFDIDGTLIKSGGAGKNAMETAFEELFKIKDGMAGISFAGSTDLGVYEKAMQLNQIDKNNAILEPIFRAKYLSLLQKFLIENREGQEILPGVKSFLDHCQTRDDIYLGLVTGNYHEGAKLKLSHFNIDHYFHEGAFGCDHADRNLLPPLAIKRILEKGFELPPKDKIWVVGDTIKDIECAKTNGLPSLITFTGFSPREEILKKKPEMVVETLEEFPEFLERVLP